MDVVFCRHFKKEMPALKKAPLAGKIGQIILENVSEEAFNEWLEDQIKIINEERLDLSEEKAQRRLFEAMVAYLNIQDLV
jgi:Fe-S cluster biosynthesis and repair protein YggX